MLGTLYILATPIGNLEDISLRALRTLKEVDLVLAEDTRVTGKLLDHYEIKKPIVSYHQHSSESKKDEILINLLNGKNIALLSDAGTPGVSDPGNELIEYLLGKEGSIRIVPIPGPSSITAALSVSGFRAGEFTFLGYAPKKGLEFFREIEKSAHTVVFFESPYRINKMVDKLIDHFGDSREIFIGLELTKMYERCLRGSLKDVKETLAKEQSSAGRVRGEIVVVL